VTSLAWDWTKVVSGSRDTTVKIWDLSSGRLLDVCAGHTQNISAVALLDTHVVSASWDGRLRCWYGQA
jgi:F-box and WD-40 domain protein CDC4